MKKTWSSSLTLVEHTKQCNHNTTSLYSWSFLFQNLIYPGKKQKQGSHKMGKAVEFMSTTYKTFDEFPSALNLLSFFIGNLCNMRHKGNINALLFTNEIKKLKQIAIWLAKGSRHIPKITCFIVATATPYKYSNQWEFRWYPLDQSVGQLKHSPKLPLVFLYIDRNTVHVLYFLHTIPSWNSRSLRIS